MSDSNQPPSSQPSKPTKRYPASSSQRSSSRTSQVQEAKPRVRKIGSLVGQLMSRRGYAQVAVNDELQAVIVSAVGSEVANSLQVGNLKRGVLQVYASDSVTLQELNFQKRQILKKIQKEMPQSGVTDLRFRIQA